MVSFRFLGIDPLNPTLLPYSLPLFPLFSLELFSFWRLGQPRDYVPIEDPEITITTKFASGRLDGMPALCFLWHGTGSAGAHATFHVDIPYLFFFSSSCIASSNKALSCFIKLKIKNTKLYIQKQKKKKKTLKLMFKIMHILNFL